MLFVSYKVLSQSINDAEPCSWQLYQFLPCNSKANEIQSFLQMTCYTFHYI